MLCLLLLALAQSADYEAGLKLFQRGELAEAQVAFERAVLADPKMAAAWKALGAVYAAQGQHSLASEPFRKACDLDPNLEDACYYLARNRYLINQFQEARTLFEQLLKRDPYPPRIHNGLGLTLEALGETGPAESEFRRAIEPGKWVGNANEDPRINLGVLLVRLGRAAEALAPLQEAAARPSPRASFELGRALHDLGRNDEARRHLEECVRLDPRHWAGHLLLGKVYYRLGRDQDGARHTRIGDQGSRTVR